MNYHFEEQRPSTIPIVVLDTETTGLFPAMGHRVVELGAVRFENWQAVGQISQLIYPERKMDPKASAVNGITDADLNGQPTFAGISEELFGLLDGALLVAHNAEFDAGFLSMELHLNNQPVLPNPWLCTLRLARQHFHFGRNNLGHVARQLGVRMGQAHRALSDVHMTAEVLKRMTHQLARRRLQTVGDLLHAQGGAVYTPPISAPALPSQIQQAIEQAVALRIRYQSGRSNTQRIVTPRYATRHRGKNYLVAYCHLRHDQRTFRLDRILQAEIID